MAENFDKFKAHRRAFKYLNNTNSIQLGSGYSHTSGETGPKLKEFTLTFRGFRYYFKSDNSNEVDYEKNKDVNNLGTLCQFYEEMNLNTTFIYNDWQFGSVKVRFKEPPSIPETVGDRGFVSDFNIVLQESTI